MESKLKDMLTKHIELNDERVKLEKSINVDEIVSNYTYEDKPKLDEILKLASECRAYWMTGKINEALAKMKSLAYPEIDKVRYYKKYLDKLQVELSEETLIAIDRDLNSNFNPRFINCSLRTPVASDKHRLLMQELYQMEVIAPTVYFPQMCGCWSGGEKRLGNRKYSQTVYDFFGVDEDDEEGLIEAVGMFDLSCDNCGDEYHVSEHDLELIKDQYDAGSLHSFKVIAEPDRSLDEI